MFVLDTNTLSYFFRGEGRIAERLTGVSPAEVGIPAIVLFELESGIARSVDEPRRKAQLDEALSSIQIMPFGRREAQAAARVRAGLEATGKPNGPYDVLIAGTALAHGATLITRNVREFKRVDGLVLENWY